MSDFPGHKGWPLSISAKTQPVHENGNGGHSLLHHRSRARAKTADEPVAKMSTAGPYWVSPTNNSGARYQRLPPPPPIVHPTAGEDRQKKKTRNTGGALLRGNIFRVGGPLASCGQNGKDYAGVCKRGPQQNIAGVLMVRAKPKSQSFTIFSREMSTFSGFTSRWMTCPPTAAAMGKDRRPPDIRRGPGCAQSGGQATHAVGMTKLQAAQDLEGDLFELDIIESCSPAEMGGKRGCAATWQ